VAFPVVFNYHFIDDINDPIVFCLFLCLALRGLWAKTMLSVVIVVFKVPLSKAQWCCTIEQ